MALKNNLGFTGLRVNGDVRKFHDSVLSMSLIINENSAGIGILEFRDARLINSRSNDDRGTFLQSASSYSHFSLNRIWSSLIPRINSYILEATSEFCKSLEIFVTCGSVKRYLRESIFRESSCEH